AGHGVVALAIARTGVDRFPEYPGDFAYVCCAALTAFDLDRCDTDAGELGKQLERMQAARLLDGVISLGAHAVPPFAQRRISGLFSRLVAIDQHAVQARFQPCVSLLPAYRGGRRTYAIQIRPLPGDEGRHRASSLDHDAEAAKAEHL